VIIPRVKSFNITRNGAWAWAESFGVSLSPVRISPQPTARSLMLAAPATPANALTKPVDGPKISCSIDSVNGQPYDPARPAHPRDRTLKLEGWTAPVEPAESIEAWIVLTDANGSRTFFRAVSTDRPDIARHFNRPELKRAGFSVILDLSGRALNGTQRVSLYSVSDGAAFACPFDFNVNLTPS
jgi:hypothetical protein